jgi:hypothetical protein
LIRSRTGWQRSTLTMVENAIALIVGTPIFIEKDPGAEVPWTPFPSAALFSE